jgi:hypothetical protein
MAVRIDYEYRDADNYRRGGSWTVEGVPDEAALMATLSSDGFFVPDAVGMPMLTPAGDEWDDEVDHAFHSILSVRKTDDPTNEVRNFDALVRAFTGADWDRSAVEHAMVQGA